MKQPLDILLDGIDYTPVNTEPNKDGIPYVTHEGELQIGDTSVKVLMLSDGQRIIPSEDIERLFSSFNKP